MADPFITLSLDGHDVRVSNPDKIYFPSAGISKIDVVNYYLAVGDAALLAVRNRPMMLKRYVHGADKEPFFQKRAPEKRPDWIQTATFHYPSGRSADEVCVNNLAQLAWVVNLGCIEMHVHPVRGDDMDHPDELRIDLDPVAGVGFKQVVDVAHVAHEVLNDFNLVGWPKTSGSRGVHIWVRIHRLWPFTEVRRAGFALAKEIQRRAPSIATAVWRKEERSGVLVDYNQNARDRTTAAAYSVRAKEDARVSMAVTWNDLMSCDPADFTLRTVPALVKKNGDAHAAIDEHVGSLDALLELADEQDAAEGKKPKAKGKKARLPVITIAQAKEKADAMAGLERWKAKHADVVKFLAAEDFIVDANRGRSSAWYRVRINLKSVPEEMRPPQGTPDPDYDFRIEGRPDEPPPSKRNT